MLAGIVLSHEAEGPPTPVHSDFLQAYERYRTRSPEAAEVASAAFLSPHRLSVGRDRDDFQAMGRFADSRRRRRGSHELRLRGCDRPCGARPLPGDRDTGHRPHRGDAPRAAARRVGGWFHGARRTR